MGQKEYLKIGIDALWVRPGIVGGTESYLRNLLKGFGEYGQKHRFLLYTAMDNDATFREFERYGNIECRPCEVRSANRAKRILWENAKLDKKARADGVDVMFIPVYSKPNSKPVDRGGIPYVACIHDLQALHYPEYFGSVKKIFLKRAWAKTCRTAAAVATISDYCKEDICRHYPAAKDKLYRIYNPITEPDPEPKSIQLLEPYGLTDAGYDYCVSSLLPHKNLDTLLQARARSEDRTKLVISGVGGRKEAFDARVRELGLQDRVIDTGFVTNEVRDALYDHCRIFLFPSIFEGFGMPPIEAMMHGCTVITTRESCLEEVTQGRAIYVSDARDPEEWNRVIRETVQNSPAEAANEKAAQEKTTRTKQTFPEYSLKTIAGQYCELLEQTARKASEAR